MRVILVSKNFAANKGVSHIGLGVAGLNTMKVLKQHDILSEVWQVVDFHELRKRINLSRLDKHPVTHIIISAPWIQTDVLAHFCRLFPRIHFAVNCHSNVGFLQADPNGMKLLREGLELEMFTSNFQIAANAKKMAKWIENAYGQPCAYLPNLYYLHPITDRHRAGYHYGSRIRIGCFGAIRAQKNIVSAAAAAIEIGRELKARTEIWISSGRTEGGASTVLNTVREMCKHLPTTTLHEAGWHTWPSFRRLVGSMDLLLQPSYTESFNMVTADGIAEGVPSVVSEAIDWAPKDWRANPDDVFDIARVGKYLLLHSGATSEGLHALKSHNHAGVEAWKLFLGIKDS